MSAEHTVPFANTNSRKVFDEFFFLFSEINIDEKKELRQITLSLVERVEASLKAFDVSPKILRLKNIIFLIILLNLQYNYFMMYFFLIDLRKRW